jgi:hypothetical protein
MIEGFIGDWRIRVQLEKEPKDGDEKLAGYWAKDESKQQGLIGIDENAGAIAMLNVLIHEPLHAVKSVYGLKLKHKDIYIIASAITQFLVSTRILDPLAVEARVRTLAADSQDPEWKEEQ